MRRPRWLASLLLGSLVAASGATAPALAQDASGPRILHLPLRWCVLEGTAAARQGASAAVMERIRRGSSILAPTAGITLRSPFEQSLAAVSGFPVISDPRASGRLGDVRVPTESSVEYLEVVQRCAAAWERLARRAASGSGLGGVAKGPVAVIIRDFVSGSGSVVNVWGYAFSASTNPDYCDARDPSISRASGGSMLVVDTSDGYPSADLDRRLVAHEVGHILKLGHGNGIDDRGSVGDRIDKFCDDTENPDVAPGSLMSASLRYERVMPFQARLMRNTAARHPSVLQDLPQLRPRPPALRIRQLQRWANGGSLVITRVVRGVSPLSPLPPLRSAGTLGDWVADRLRDRGARGASDLESVGVSVDEESGDVDVWHTTSDTAGEDSTSEGTTGVDEDGDAGTGGGPFDPPGGGPRFDTGALAGVDAIIWTRADADGLRGRAWRWDAVVSEWREQDVKAVERSGSFGEGADAPTASTVVVTLPPGALQLSDRFRIHTTLRTVDAEGEETVDVLGGRPARPSWSGLSLETPTMPVCAVSRNALAPGRVAPGGVAAVEVYGFGKAGPVDIWLGDAERPIATGQYDEMPDDPWPWVTEVAIPVEAPESLAMLQVEMPDTGLSAECPVLVGDAPLPVLDE